MKRLTRNSPCLCCKEDQQAGNPEYWQSPCSRCEKISEWRSKIYERLEVIEDILEQADEENKFALVLIKDKIGRKLVKCDAMSFETSHNYFEKYADLHIKLHSTTDDIVVLEDKEVK